MLFRSLAAFAAHYGVWRSNTAEEMRLAKNKANKASADRQLTDADYLKMGQVSVGLHQLVQKQWVETVAPQNKELVEKAIRLASRVHNIENSESDILRMVEDMHYFDDEEGYARRYEKNPEFFQALKQLKDKLAEIPVIIAVKEAAEGQYKKSLAAERARRIEDFERIESGKVSRSASKYPWWRGLASAAGGAAVGALLAPKRRKNRGTTLKPTEPKRDPPRFRWRGGRNR